MTYYCQSCGKKIHNTDVFCQSCGSRIVNFYSKEPTIIDTEMESPNSKQTKQQDKRLIFWVAFLISLILLLFVQISSIRV